MGHIGHPGFIKTAPLEVAIKSEELKKYYECKKCCFAGHEGDHWVDLIACDSWPDLAYYAGYYSIFSKDQLDDPQLAEELVLLDGIVVDARDIPALESGQTIILIHGDATMTSYQKIDEFTSVVEALYHDPDLEADFDDMTVLIGKLRGVKWTEQIIRQMKRWITMFEKQKTEHRMARLANEVMEADG